MIKDFEWFNNAMDKIFSGLDHILKYIPGLSSGAKERLQSRAAVASLGSSITVPKEPKASTLKSPSAVSTTPPAEVPNAPSGVPATPTGVVAGIENPPRTSDINSVLSYQSAILVQILESSQNLVSVNRDILKYSKVHS